MRRILSTILALLIAAPLYAQNANLAQVRLVIVDQTGAGIPAAMVTLTPQSSGQTLTATSDERGLATLPDVALGVAQLHVEFPGFLPTDMQLTLRRGANNQTKLMTKKKSNWCHLLACSSPQYVLQLLYWDLSKLFSKIWRTRKANVMNCKPRLRNSKCWKL
jgi:hypothetical protein